MDIENNGALKNLNVLDLSRVLAGPWASQILGDLGANVVKIEKPEGGDDTRHWGPPFVDGGNEGDSDAAYFTSCNRNKRSVTIDFSKPEGSRVVRRLAMDSDILIENFQVGGLKKYGLDYESLKALNPGIIYCSISGFGQDGPYAHRPGYDFLIQGMGGLMAITGLPDGVPGGGPVKVGVAVTDLFTGMYAAVSILAAITHRIATGEGQHIDCSLLDSQIAMLANQNANLLVGGQVPSRLGNNHPNVVPYSVYAAKDGYLIIACGNDSQFNRLCIALDLLDDPRFHSNGGRVAGRTELDRLISAKLVERRRDEVMSLLEAVGVPCGPINELPEVFADPHVTFRQLEVVLIRKDGVRIPTVAFPSRLSLTPASYRNAPPTLGQDTESVLLKYYDQAQLEKLRSAGVI